MDGPKQERELWNEEEVGWLGRKASFWKGVPALPRPKSQKDRKCDHSSVPLKNSKKSKSDIIHGHPFLPSAVIVVFTVLFIR